MKPNFLYLLPLVPFVIASIGGTSASSQTGTPQHTPSQNISKPALTPNYGKLPLSFEANQGQTDSQVRFTSRGQGYSLFLTDKQSVLTLTKSIPTQTSPCHPDDEGGRTPANYQPPRIHPVSGHNLPYPIGVHNSGCPIQDGGGIAGLSGKSQTSLPKADTIRMQFAGADPNLQASAEDRLPGTANYLIGNDPSKWHTAVPTYSKVAYKGIYPGVDLVYYGNQRQLEYDFVVAPGADPKQIKLHFAGAEKLKLEANGDLTILAKNGKIAFHKPVIYQSGNGRQADPEREPVPGTFTLLARNTVGFTLGEYDRSRPVVIDPTLAYSTYLGDGSGNFGSSIAVDASGNIYLAGSAYPFGSTTSNYAYVTKLNPQGTALVYSTNLGGSTGSFPYDGASNIAVDASGDAYVTGRAGTTNFPVTPGAFQTVNHSTGGNAFVAKLNPEGALIYSTYLGGSSSNGDSALGIAIDSGRNAYVTGPAYSTDFPITAKAYQTSKTESDPDTGDSFVTKFNPTGTALVYSTYLGGSNGGETGDQEDAIAIDPSGDAYVTGVTDATDFPTTKEAFKTKPDKDGVNIIVTKLNPTGSALLYSTYLGGPVPEFSGSAIALDPSGNVYIAGTSGAGYPVTTGAFQTKSNAPSYGFNAVVTKLDPTGSSLVYSTFLGGSLFQDGNYADYGGGVAIDSEGNAYVSGTAYSTDFPVTSNAFQGQNNAAALGTSNAFLTELNAAGSSLIYSTYLGGTGIPGLYEQIMGDEGGAIVLDPAGNFYVTGTAYSTDFPVTPDAYQTGNHGDDVGYGMGNNAFMTKFSAATKVATDTDLTSNPNPQVVGAPVIFTAVVKAKTGSGIPTGTVGFSVGGPPVNVTLTSDGHASYETSSLDEGVDTVIATYYGDADYAAGTSSPLTQNIGEAAAIPTFSPGTGTYPGTQEVTISDTTPDATIYFSLNGATPTTSDSKYTKPISTGISKTIKAIAVAPGYTDSAVGSATYTIVKAAATPTSSPGTGTYPGTQEVTISDTTPGATIYFSLNGATPTSADSIYTKPIATGISKTIKAIAVAAGYTDSAVGSATYTIK
jgi:hypothetical protein